MILNPSIGKKKKGYYFLYPGCYCGWMSDGTEADGSISHHRETWESTKYASNCGAWLNSNFTLPEGKFTKLHFKANLSHVRTTYRPEFGVASNKVSSVSSSASPMKTYAYKFSAEECSLSVIEHVLDVSNASGNFYCYYSGVAAIEIVEFWLE